MSLQVTRRLPGMLLAALAVYFFATNSQVVWLYLISAMMLALIPVGLLGPILTLRRLSARVESLTHSGFSPPLSQDRGKVFAGDRVDLVLRTTGNPAACSLGPIRLSWGELAEVQNPDEIFGTGVTRLSVTAGRRGRIEFQGLRVSTSWPLGILTAQWWLPLSTSLLVHPRYFVPTPKSTAPELALTGESFLRGAGEEFLGLRQYRTGDSQRRVHWATTARSGNLMVIETAVESSSPAYVSVHLAEDATPDAQELAVSIAASLVAAEVAAGRPFRLALPAEIQPVQRWDQGLARLAELRATPTDSRRREATGTTVAADGGEVHVQTAGGEILRLDTTTLATPLATLGLDAARRALEAM